MDIRTILQRTTIVVFFLCLVEIRLHESGTISVAESTSNEDSCDGQSKSSQRLREALDAMEESNCKDCALRKANLTHEELKLLRFEIAKLQILQRLQLSKPPCITAPKPALEPILQAADMDNVTEDDEYSDSESKDRTKSYVIFPNEDEQLPCLETKGYPCTRLSFQLPQELDNKLISSSEVWLYKRNPSDLLKITELVFDPDDESFANMTDLATEVPTATNLRLVKFQLQNTTTWSMRNEYTVFEVQITCYSHCTLGSTSGVVSPDGQEKPFLLVKAINDKAYSRNRRSVDCEEDSVLCCKEKLHMSFASIGWDNFIIAPESYEINYCRGKCYNDVGSSRYYHSSLIHRYMTIQDQNSISDDIGLKMCCTPSKMSSLSILYMNENNTVVKSDLLNMKVESCDCV